MNTRHISYKEAIDTAIDALKNVEQTEYISVTILKLNQLKERLPKRWTKESICEAVDTFEANLGRRPRANDFNRNGMPTTVAVQKVFHMTVLEFLRYHYGPDYGKKRAPYPEYTSKEPLIKSTLPYWVRIW